MPLSGTNNKCAKCSQKCKQWSQVKVIQCPNWKPSGQHGIKNAPEAHS